MPTRVSRWGSSFWHVYDPREKPPIGNTTYPISCPTCGTHTDGRIIANFVTKPNDFISLPASEMVVLNYFLQCTRCDSAILAMWAYGENHRDTGLSAGALVYPLPTTAFETEALGGAESIPAAILEDLRQAELSYYVRAHYGAGLLIRRACQYLCRDKKAQGKDLMAEIDDLATKGFITRPMADMAHGIRIIGNELAHPAPHMPFVITPEDVREAREFLTQLIRVVYVDPHRSTQLRAGLAQRGVKGVRGKVKGSKSMEDSDPSSKPS